MNTCCITSGWYSKLIKALLDFWYKLWNDTAIPLSHRQQTAYYLVLGAVSTITAIAVKQAVEILIIVK